MFEIMWRLVHIADVLTKNYILGKLATMGLGWKDCRALNGRPPSPVRGPRPTLLMNSRGAGYG